MLFFWKLIKKNECLFQNKVKDNHFGLFFLQEPNLFLWLIKEKDSSFYFISSATFQECIFLLCARLQHSNKRNNNIKYATRNVIVCSIAEYHKRKPFENNVSELFGTRFTKMSTRVSHFYWNITKVFCALWLCEYIF